MLPLTTNDCHTDVSKRTKSSAIADVNVILIWLITYFTNRVVSTKNSVPIYVVSANMLNSFRSRLDKYHLTNNNVYCLPSTLFTIFVHKFKETEAKIKWQLIIGSLTRSSAVTKRQHVAACRWKFCHHSKSLEFMPLSTLQVPLFQCNYVHVVPLMVWYRYSRV